MINWHLNNLGAIIVSLVLAVVVFLIIFKLIRDKKQGKSSCGCGCEHCAMAGKCKSGIK